MTWITQLAEREENSQEIYGSKRALHQLFCLYYSTRSPAASIRLFFISFHFSKRTFQTHLIVLRTRQNGSNAQLCANDNKQLTKNRSGNLKHVCAFVSTEWKVIPCCALVASALHSLCWQQREQSALNMYTNTWPAPAAPVRFTQKPIKNN